MTENAATTQATATSAETVAPAPTGFDYSTLFKDEAPAAPAPITPETPATEQVTAPVTEPAKEPVTPPVSDRTKQLIENARKAREARQADRKAKEETDGVRALIEAKARAKEDPLAALRAMGIEPDDVFGSVIKDLGGQKPQTPEEIASRIADEKLAKFKADWEATQAQAAQARTVEGNQQALSQYQASIKSTVTADPGKFAALNHLGDEGLEIAKQYASEVARTEDRIPSPEECATHAEKAIYANFEKLATVLGFSKSQPPAAGTQAVTQATPGRPTLTNRGASEVSALQRQTPPTESEAKRQAAALLKWE